MTETEPKAEALPRHASSWSGRDKAVRILWAFTEATIFRYSFHNWYPWRAMILRWFGANVGNNVRVRRTVRIEIPWNVSLADDVIVGDAVILYALGPITIGARALVSQYAHLCAGSHDYTKPEYPLLKPPITIGADVWIAADAFIGPGVTVGDRAIVGARSSVFKDVPPNAIVGGNPARVIKNRSD